MERISFEGETAALTWVIDITERKLTAEMLRKRPEMLRDGYKVGDKVPGRVLHHRLELAVKKPVGRQDLTALERKWPT